MKRIPKALRIGVIVFGGVVFVILAMAAFYVLRFRSEIAKMTPLDTQGISENIFVLRDEYVNVYLVGCGTDYIAFDAGQSEQNLQQQMESLGLNAQDVDAVFLTHTDTDHVAGLNLFSNATVYISKDEEQMVNGQTPRQSFFHNTMGRAYETLEDKQSVEIGECRVTGVATPGHTPGSMAYVVNDVHLFSGDTLSLKDGKAAPFNEFFNMDTPTQLQSIARLSKLDRIENIYTGHYGMAERSALDAYR